MKVDESGIKKLAISYNKTINKMKIIKSITQKFKVKATL